MGFIVRHMRLFVSIFFFWCFWTLTGNYVNDGNTWAIYRVGVKLVVGDFWAALFANLNIGLSFYHFSKWLKNK